MPHKLNTPSFFITTLIILSLVQACGKPQQQVDNDKLTVNNALIKLGTDLHIQQVKMHDIEQFHLFRTSSEKQRQMQQQAQVINNIKMKMASLMEVLEKMEKGEDYTIDSLQLK